MRAAHGGKWRGRCHRRLERGVRPLVLQLCPRPEFPMNASQAVAPRTADEHQRPEQESERHDRHIDEQPERRIGACQT
jgi:hypothetical protein